MVAMRDSFGTALAVGRFTGWEPLGFEAGDNNWYRFLANGPTQRTDPNGLWTMFGQEFVTPWDPNAGTVFETMSAYGSAVTVAAAGIVSGAAAGAVSGAVVGAGTGATIGAVGGAGIGAGPGALAGAGAGSAAGAIGGGISGLITAAFSANVSDAAINGGFSGAVSGGLSGLGGGLGAGLGAGGTRPLTHFTSTRCAQSIQTGLGGQGQLGTKAASNLFASTGAPGLTGATSTVSAIQITGVAASHFRPPLPIGPITAFQYAAGHMIGPQGVVNLSTGAIVTGGGANSVALVWRSIDAFINVAVGWKLSSTQAEHHTALEPAK